MNKKFPLHDETTALEAAAAMLAQTKAAFGMIPNLERTMATAPSLLEAYGTLWALFEKTSFTPQEQQIVYQTVNVEHGCNY